MTTYKAPTDRRQDLVSKLAVRIAGLGIHVPDQERVAQMMELTRLGFSPYTTPRTWERRLMRLVRARVRYRVFNSVVEHAPEAEHWGGHMPLELREAAERIRHALPAAKVRIYALRKDPWVSVALDDEEVFIGGWYPDENFHSRRINI